MKRTREDEPVRALIAQKLIEHADSFDVWSTSGWIMNHKCAREFEREQKDKFVLNSPVLCLRQTILCKFCKEEISALSFRMNITFRAAELSKLVTDTGSFGREPKDLR